MNKLLFLSAALLCVAGAAPVTFQATPQARAQKMRAMRQQVFAHTIDDWADSFLTELGE